MKTKIFESMVKVTIVIEIAMLLFALYAIYRVFFM